MDYLDFELPIKELQEQLERTVNIEKETKVDMSKTIKELEKNIVSTRKQIQNNLTSWQRVQLSRHPQRPYTLAYIEALTD